MVNLRAVLLGVLVSEVAVFSVVAPNFLTMANAFEVIRLSVEVGLLAVAMTPVLVTGGIDLSVGAAMGLAAVALLVGCMGGALNAALIAGLQIPPLIVTLGSLALFRGLAEGITRGTVNYSGFPASLLRLGQGYLWGVVPAQVPVFLAVVAAYVVLLHRSVVGRAWYAIGFASAGARYAGIPVARRVGLAYALSGVVASIAAIVYVAHLGQARADAGTGYELDAIPRPCWAGPPSSADGGTFGARSAACSRSRCCRTASISRRCRRSLLACS